MKVVGVVQARFGSRRLPGKVLAELAGVPMLDHIIRRVQAARRVDEVVVAVADEPGSGDVVETALGLGVLATLGSPDDVLDRVVGAARTRQATVVVRITADDPFKDPDVIDRVVASLTEEPGVDYASNTLHPTFPEGLDVEAVTLAALESAWREAALPSEREHVTPFIWNRPDRFTLRSVEHDPDLSALRWTVDYPDDLRFARAVYTELAPATDFGLDAVLDLLDRNPELARLMPRHVRNEGYAASLADERRSELR